MTYTVLLADDQALIRTGFRMILDSAPDLTVIGEAADGAEAIQLAHELRPDVIVMDVRMPGIDGIEATAAIGSEQPTTKILVLTTFDLDDYAFAALRAGASGFLLKDATAPELIKAVLSVARGDAVLSPRMTRHLLDLHYASLPKDTAALDDPHQKLAALTAREREVLLEIAAGKSNGDIAASLFVSEATVKTHIGSILSKLGLRSRVQAVIFAYEAGLVQ